MYVKKKNMAQIIGFSLAAVVILVLGIGHNFIPESAMNSDNIGIKILKDNPIKNNIFDIIKNAEEKGANSVIKAQSDAQNNNKKIFYIIDVEEVNKFNKKVIWYSDGFSDDKAALEAFAKSYNLDTHNSTWASTSYTGPIVIGNKKKEVADKYNKSGLEVKELSTSEIVINGYKSRKN